MGVGRRVDVRDRVVPVVHDVDVGAVEAIRGGLWVSPTMMVAMTVLGLFSVG